MFGSDEFADFGNVPVFRFDAGADSYEQMQFLISTYENRYIFNNFRRNLVTFNTDAVVERTEQRYWDKVQQISKGLALGVELETIPGGADPTTDPGQPHADGPRVGRRLRDVRPGAHAARARDVRGHAALGGRAAEPVGSGVAAR